MTQAILGNPRKSIVWFLGNPRKNPAKNNSLKHFLEKQVPRTRLWIKDFFLGYVRSSVSRIMLVALGMFLGNAIPRNPVVGFSAVPRNPGVSRNIATFSRNVSRNDIPRNPVLFLGMLPPPFLGMFLGMPLVLGMFLGMPFLEILSLFLGMFLGMPFSSRNTIPRNPVTIFLGCFLGMPIPRIPVDFLGMPVPWNPIRAGHFLGNVSRIIFFCSRGSNP